MADEVDLAAEYQEKEIAAILAGNEARKLSEERELLRSAGSCLNCQSIVSVGRFCDQDCRDDYERRVLRR